MLGELRIYFFYRTNLYIIVVSYTKALSEFSDFLLLFLLRCLQFQDKQGFILHDNMLLELYYRKFLEWFNLLNFHCCRLTVSDHAEVYFFILIISNEFNTFVLYT